MSNSVNLRGLAAMAVGRVVDAGASLDTVLEDFAPKVAERDRGLSREMVYGALRWHGAYSAQLKSYLKKPFKPKDRCLQHLLVCACYQLDFLQLAPHAVVNESVSACRYLKREWAKGLVNGVLRSILRDRPQQVEAGAVQDTPIPPHLNTSTALQHCFPEWLLADLSQHWPDDLDAILAASNQKPPMTLRVNQQRRERESALLVLKQSGIEARNCEFSPVGLQLEQGMPVADLPGFSAGELSVQDESAQLVAPLLSLEPGLRVLDACAAPGGKTAHLLESCADLQEVVAIDFASRLDRLHSNMQRLGLDVTVKAGDATALGEWWDGVPFDRVLLDVPCSGTGVIRRHADIRYRREAADIARFAKQQRALLESGWQVLAAGGLLLYTTCSILPQENQGVIAAFLAEHAKASLLPLPDWLGLDTGAGRQRLTGVHSGDGFFYALLRKA